MRVSRRASERAAHTFEDRAGDEREVEREHRARDEIEQARHVRRQVAVEQPQVEPERMDHVADVEGDEMAVRDQAAHPPAQPRVVAGVVAARRGSASRACEQPRPQHEHDRDRVHRRSPRARRRGDRREQLVGPGAPEQRRATRRAARDGHRPSGSATADRGADSVRERSTGRSSPNQLTLAAKTTTGSATTRTTNQLPCYSGQPSQSATMRRSTSATGRSRS